MAQETLRDIVARAVADYGFRLAVMWGTDDVVARAGLSPRDGDRLRALVVPELKALPDPVEPADRPAVEARLWRLAADG